MFESTADSRKGVLAEFWYQTPVVIPTADAHLLTNPRVEDKWLGFGWNERKFFVRTLTCDSIGFYLEKLLLKLFLRSKGKYQGPKTALSRSGSIWT